MRTIKTKKFQPVLTHSTFLEKNSATKKQKTRSFNDGAFSFEEINTIVIEKAQKKSKLINFLRQVKNNLESPKLPKINYYLEARQTKTYQKFLQSINKKIRINPIEIKNNWEKKLSIKKAEVFELEDDGDQIIITSFGNLEQYEALPDEIEQPEEPETEAEIEAEANTEAIFKVPSENITHKLKTKTEIKSIYNYYEDPVDSQGLNDSTYSKSITGSEMCSELIIQNPKKKVQLTQKYYFK